MKIGRGFFKAVLMKSAVICLMLLCGQPVFSQANSEHQINLGDKRFSAITGKKDKGVLVISNNKISNNFILNFYDPNTGASWQKEIKNEELGYIESQLISKNLKVYFTDNSIFLVFIPYYDIVKSIVVYTAKLDYKGNYTTSNVTLPGKYKVKGVFLNDTIPAVLLEQKVDEFTVKNFKANLCHKAKEVCDITPVELDQHLSTRTPSIITKDYLFFHASGGGLKTDGSVNAYLHITDHKGKLKFARTLAVKPDPYYPATDYDNYYVRSIYSILSEDSYTHIYSNLDYNTYCLYGMFTKNKDAGAKLGFYINRYNFLNEEQFRKLYLYSEHAAAFPELKKFEKGGNKVTSLTIEPVTGNLVYFVEAYFKKTPEVFCFVILPDGTLKEVTRAEKFEKLNSQTKRFFVTGNSDINEELSAYYTDCTNTLTAPALNALQTVKKNYSASTNSPVFNILLSEKREVITAFFPSENKVIIHNLHK